MSIQLSKRRQAYEQAVELSNQLSWLVDALYSQEDFAMRMEQMTAVRNTQKDLTKALKPLVENSPSDAEFGVRLTTEQIVEDRASVSAQLKQANDEKTELQSIAMREWLEKIYAQQGWSDLGQFLKSQEAAQ